ncbi:cytidine and deoxycytidylate deaminase [Niveomyces insectorum RCEF 264]|uniref:Cytidine and deoxycytidylate deaminase n=1 Tax=Niveomyces insectorum RCEF 264 TaxID=1081102 RepID=A0A167WV65_9HYPO|nr:cytidine and deoxycytidylate deaminase [Niveomyces insectorum RCEF 264]
MDPPVIAPGDHLAYLRYTLSLAEKSPPRPSNFRVGAVLVDAATGAVLATGYTLELPGNTHAEQCCLLKLAARHGVSEAGLAGLDATVLPTQLALYTTMEPCSFRLSGNLPCVQRILRLLGKRVEAAGDGDGGGGGDGDGGGPARTMTVYVGLTEPTTFVDQNTGRATLVAAGVQVVHVPGLEEAILAVATAGHVAQTDELKADGAGE